MAIKKTTRKGFNFFRSYYDVYNELGDKDKIMFMDALLDKQFLNIDPVELSGMASFAYISQTNSIDGQVKGYNDKMRASKKPTIGVYLPPTDGGKTPPTEQGKEKGEVKGKEKEKEIKTINNKKEFFSSGVWFSTLAVQSNGFKLEAIEEYANEFWEYKKSIDQAHNKIDDIKSHFGRWLKIKLDKVRKEPMGDPNYIYYEWERGGGGVMQKVERHRAKAHFENMKGGGYKAIIKKQ